MIDEFVTEHWSIILAIVAFIGTYAEMRLTIKQNRQDIKDNKLEIHRLDSAREVRERQFVELKGSIDSAAKNIADFIKFYDKQRSEDLSRILKELDDLKKTVNNSNI